MREKFFMKDGRPLRTVFMGTPDFAIPSLKKLMMVSDVLGVFTQIDRPKGRGQKLKPAPVKVYAEKNGLNIYQPESLKIDEVYQILHDLAPDLIVVTAFGQILTKKILDLPPYGAINVHASLLPKYRGAAPMEYALLNGEQETGITTMMMDRGLDTGDILLQTNVKISDEMNFGQLHDIMMEKGADLLVETIHSLLQGNLTPKKQLAENASYTAKIDKNIGRINWQLSSTRLHNLVRALSPHIGAFAYLGREKFKIFRTRVSTQCGGNVGEVIAFTKYGLLVQTGEGSLEILELQVPNRRKMSAKDYLLGHNLTIGDYFS